METTDILRRISSNVDFDDVPSVGVSGFGRSGEPLTEGRTGAI